nr:hypothetical protein CFP56_31012 [Quercus suber]
MLDDSGRDCVGYGLDKFQGAVWPLQGTLDMSHMPRPAVLRYFQTMLHPTHRSGDDDGDSRSRQLQLATDRIRCPPPPSRPHHSSASNDNRRSRDKAPPEQVQGNTNAFNRTTSPRGIISIPTSLPSSDGSVVSPGLILTRLTPPLCYSYGDHFPSVYFSTTPFS